MCVEAAVCYALGLPHGDDPGCVSPALRRLKIRLNDAARWSSPMARAAGLRRLAIAQLGSAGVLDDNEFVRHVVEMTIRKVVPVGLRAAATLNPTFADKLEAAAVRCEAEGTRASARSAQGVSSKARRAAAYASASAAFYAASAAADAFYAASAAADASDASAYAAYASAAYAYAASASVSASVDAYADAAYAASASAAAAAAYAAYAVHASAAAAARTRDRVLGEYAEWVVEILIAMKAPGCEWLDLVPVAEGA